ncbi:MAG: threonine/serine exporter family protein, partial [Bacteroidales bacterium]|nr:threonine/serine exporter family protein [Bacteroidales bacterium]
MEETMERIAEHYGESKENFFVLSNGIFTTGESYSHVEFIPIKGAKLEKVVQVNQLSRDIVSKGITLEQAWQELDRIDSTPAKPYWEQLLAAVFGCAGFCVIFGGGLMDSLAAVAAGLILYSFILFIGDRFLS